MRHLSSILLAALFGSLPPPTAIGQEAEPPAQAQEESPAVDALWRSLGGREAYDALPYLEFGFRVEQSGEITTSRRYLWDRAGDRARVEIPTERGEVVILLDLESGEGSAFENGEPVPESDGAAVVKVGHDLFRNDARWLTFPWTLRDAGLTVALDEDPIEREGASLRRLRVKIDEEAIDPYSRVESYSLLLDAETMEPREWSFRVPGMPPEQASFAHRWEGWQEVGGVRFSTERAATVGDQRILLGPLSAPSEIDESRLLGP